MEDAAHVHALDLSNEIAGVQGTGSWFRLKGVGDAAHLHALDLSNEIAVVDASGFRLKGFRLRG